MIRQHAHAKNERGIAMAYVAVAMVAVFALVAVGIDLSHIAFTAVEAQNAAEIAATAYATAKLGGATAGAAMSQTTSVLSQNRVNGQSATNAVPSSNIAVGNYANGVFTSNANGQYVQATASTTVNNLLGPIWAMVPSGSSHPTSTVTKTAVATFASLGGGTPNVPIALCNCTYNANCSDNSCEPAFTIPSPTNNAAWTGFNLGHSDSTIQSFMPTACGGSGNTAPALTAGTSTVDVTNGAGTPPFTDLRCMVCTLGMCSAASPCLVPIISCSCPGGPINGNQSVVGFAEVVINDFQCTGGGGSDCACGQTQRGSVKGVGFQSVFMTDVPGPPSPGGCANNPTCNFGASFVQLVG